MTGDLAALQGVWKQVAVEMDGIADPPDEFSAPGTLCTITGTHFAVHAPDGSLLLEGDFTLDETTSPRRVTWVDSMGPDTGKRLPAIYELTRDDFVFNAADEGAPFPASFRTAQGQTMRRFRRKVESDSCRTPLTANATTEIPFSRNHHKQSLIRATSPVLAQPANVADSKTTFFQFHEAPEPCSRGPRSPAISKLMQIRDRCVPWEEHRVPSAEHHLSPRSGIKAATAGKPACSKVERQGAQLGA